MLNFRNGYKNWKIQIWQSYGVSRDIDSNVEEFIFPLCNEKGMIEEHIPVSLTQKSIDETRNNKLKGWHIQFTFHYDQYTAPEVLDKFKIIVDRWQEKELSSNLQLMLFPRLDTLDRYHSVYPDEQSIKIAIMKGRTKAKGNKGVILKFNTVEMIPKMDIVDPNNLQIGLNNLSTQ